MSAESPHYEDRETGDQELAQFETDRTGRRKALRRLGITAGAVLFFGFEDFVRLVGTKLEQYGLARHVAGDFKNMGVAFADEVCTDCVLDCVESGDLWCSDCDPSCMSTVGIGAKKAKICSATEFWAQCNPNYAPYSNPLDCCQGKCAEGCAGPGLPAAERFQRCMNKCEQLNGN